MVRAAVLEPQCDGFGGVIKMPVPAPAPRDSDTESLGWETGNHIFNRSLGASDKGGPGLIP